MTQKNNDISNANGEETTAGSHDSALHRKSEQKLLTFCLFITLIAIFFGLQGLHQAAIARQQAQTALARQLLAEARTR